VKPEHETEELARAIRASRRGGPTNAQAPSPLDRRQGAATWSERPSIAVLPFTNLGGDAEQQYLGDGITEDIIIELSRYRSLLIIARNSAFQFRGPSVDLAAVRGQLGVQFVVEGSIRKIGRDKVVSKIELPYLIENAWWVSLDRGDYPVAGHRSSFRIMPLLGLRGHNTQL
jgi:TolB-like protein